jgi:allantoinase
MTEVVGKSVRGRLPYTPIHRRPALKFPNKARVAVWTIVNVEDWSPTGAMPRAVLPPPMGQSLLPDVPNWAWHEYGMRVGYCRFIETLGSRNLKATFALNGSVCEFYPRSMRGRPRRRLGFHGPWLRAEADAQGRGPEGGDR